MTAPTKSQLVAVATAVEAGLNAASFVPRGSVSRGFMRERSLEESALVIAVFPRKERATRISRGGLLQVDLDINVGIFRSLVGTDQERDQQVETLLLLSQRIKDHFAITPLTGRTESLVEATTDATGDIEFDPATLMEKRQFEAILTLTFRGGRMPA